MREHACLCNLAMLLGAYETQLREHPLATLLLCWTPSLCCTHAESPWHIIIESTLRLTLRLPQVAADMGKLTVAGINSFKFFLAYKGAFAVTDAQLLKGLARCKELGAIPMVRPAVSVN